MTHQPPFLPVILLTGLLVGGCNKGTDTGEAEYWAPIAVAGANQVVSLGATVALDGSGSQSHPLYPEMAYTWNFVQLPVTSGLDDATFGSTNATTAAQVVSFVPDVVGTFVVSLKVSDGVLASNLDYTVIDVVSDNLPPTASCGDSQVGEVGVQIDFDGSGSDDPEGARLTYTWSLASSPDASEIATSDIFDRNTDQPSLVPDAAGTYVLSLVVSDGIDYSDPCYVSATVAAENQRPIANAGSSETLSPCASEVQLEGYGSYDPDGDTITYAWEVFSAPAGSEVTTETHISDPAIVNPMFTWDMEGEYTLSLQVYDGELESARDLVTFLVQDASANRSPTANAGADQTIEATSECTTRDYVFTCEPCAEVTFEIDGTASTDRDGDTLAYYWDEPSGDVTFGGRYLAWTEATTPEVSAVRDVATAHAYNVTLTVADCELTATDTVVITVSCTGEF